MLKKLPIVLAIVIAASIICNPIIPQDAKSIIYAISLTLKSIVLFLLPFIIFGLLFKTFVKLSDQAASIIFVIFGSLCLSNFINTFLSHYVGSFLYNMDFDLGSVVNNSDELEAYFLFTIPSVIKNEFALFGGMISGILAARINPRIAVILAEKIDYYIGKTFLFISYLIPLFIIGFVIKCASDGVLVGIIKNYFQIFLIFVSYALVYTCIIYLLINKFDFKQAISNLSNMMPAFFTALSTASSALAMPVTIFSAQKNVKNKELAGSVISATTNVHLLGDCIAIPILAYAILKSYGFAEPSLYSYLVFAVFFVIAKFSVAAIPAGGIIVMTPILEKYLGFSSEMSSLIIAVYIVFDPVITGVNVLGNGALAKLIDSFKVIKAEKMS